MNCPITAKVPDMSNPSPSRLRRQLCLALPCAVVAGTASAFQRSIEGPPPSLADQRSFEGPNTPLSIARTWAYEVALTVDLNGEVSKPVVRTRHGERAKISGVHGDKPWTLELAVAYKHTGEQLNVITRLSSGDQVLASKSVNAVAGQRVVLRADHGVYAAMIIRSA